MSRILNSPTDAGVVRAVTRPSLSAQLIARYFGQISRGKLTLVLPSGERVGFQGPTAGADAVLHFHRWRGLMRLISRGDIGFGAGYQDGDWSSPDLKSLFVWTTQNEAALSAVSTGSVAGRLLTWLMHRARANTRANSRRNISEHYDLGNAFYASWLDQGMNYSSALYASNTMSLEQAQSAKLDRIIALMDLEGGERVLEIGCGWGALAERLVSAHGCHVTGITLSQRQLDYATERLQRLGYAGQSEIRLQDYRDVTGRFDRIVSIEMIEAVGEAFWPDYFSQLRRCLTDDGVIVLQAITIDERKFDAYRRQPDFIQTHIFPGGMLPTDELVRSHVQKAGLFVQEASGFAPSYARTLVAWRERFEVQWEEVKKTGFDEPFRRLWNYYLVYCETGFESGALDVRHYRLGVRV